jgi:hypothetical protein
VRAFFIDRTPIMRLNTTPMSARIIAVFTAVLISSGIFFSSPMYSENG